MPGRGPAPKGTRSRERDMPKYDNLTITGDRYGPDLPEFVPGLVDKDGEPVQWHSQTLEWWDAVRQFPLLKDEPAIGWQFLMDTALMHHTMWTNGRWEFASELRIRVAKYGATPEDRLRLKVKVFTPREADPELAPGAGQENVTRIDARRDRLANG